MLKMTLFFKQILTDLQIDRLAPNKTFESVKFIFLHFKLEKSFGYRSNFKRYSEELYLRKFAMGGK